MKTLSRDDMKKVLGGGPPPCIITEDCGLQACTANPAYLQGYICLNNRCTWVNCA